MQENLVLCVQSKLQESKAHGAAACSAAPTCGKGNLLKMHTLNLTQFDSKCRYTQTVTKGSTETNELQNICGTHEPTKVPKPKICESLVRA